MKNFIFSGSILITGVEVWSKTFLLINNIGKRMRKKDLPKRILLVVEFQKLIKQYPPPGHYDAALKRLQPLLPLEIDTPSFKDLVYRAEYTADQMADQLLLYLSQWIVSKKGWFKAINRILYDAAQILNDPIEVIKKFQAQIDYKELYDVMMRGHYARSRGNSIDGFLEQYSYSQNALDLIVHCLKTLYELEIIFRNELYGNTKYIAIAKKYLPGDNVYYQEIINIPVKMKGKQVTMKGVSAGIDLYDNYLKGMIPSEQTADFTGSGGKFFKKYRFYYMMELSRKLSSMLNFDMFQKEQKAVSLIKLELQNFPPLVQENIINELTRRTVVPKMKSKRGQKKPIEKTLNNIVYKLIHSILNKSLPAIKGSMQTTVTPPKSTK
jgi:hypothetical protein